MVLGFLNDRLGILYSTYDVVRPKIISSGGKSCLNKLQQKDIKFKYLGDVQEKSCLIKDAVQIDKLPKTILSSGITLNCKTALDFANWAEEIEANNIVHMGSYNCRKMRSLNIMSEHSFGTAIDIATINGASVKKHWKEKSDRGEYIRKSARIACNYFSNSITPDHNALHHDHLHLDNGYGSTCMPSFIQDLENLVIDFLRGSDDGVR